MKSSNLALRLEFAEEQPGPGMGCMDATRLAAPSTDDRLQRPIRRRRSLGTRTIVSRDQGLKPFRVY